MNLKRLSEMYGNPRAVFAKPGMVLDSGQRVLVMPTGEKSETMWPGVIVKLPKKRTSVKVCVNGRTWFLPVREHQVLTEW